MNDNTRLQFSISIEDTYDVSLNNLMRVFAHFNVIYSSEKVLQPINVDSFSIKAGYNSKGDPDYPDRYPDTYVVLFSIDSTILEAMYTEYFNTTRIPNIDAFNDEQNKYYHEFCQIVSSVAF